MAISRRDFVQWSAIGLAAAACSKAKDKADKPTPTPGSGSGPDPKAVTTVKKKILILGGTGFIGPKTIAAAIDRGHTVTIFNRGHREKLLPLEFPVEHLYGNRDPDVPADDEKGPDGKLLHPDSTPKGLEQLEGRKWDVVIDNSGFYPRHVKASAELLAPNAAQYIYISSISAYGDNPASGGDENTKLATIADPKVETMGDQFQNYGGLKVLCEQAASAAFAGRATIVRPGFIVGPGDPTDRFTYWPVRIQKGGEVLAPGKPDDPTQWIDVRDLAAWLVKLAEDGTAGTFNAVGPNPPAAWGSVLDECNKAGGNKATLTWVPADWITKTAPGDQDPGFPIWVDPTGDQAGFHKWSNARATAAGLTLRPVSETIKALLEWYPGEIERRVRVTKDLVEQAKAKGTPPPPGDPSQLRAGPTEKVEAELLAKWKARAAK